MSLKSPLAHQAAAVPQSRLGSFLNIFTRAEGRAKATASIHSLKAEKAPIGFLPGSKKLKAVESQISALREENARLVNNAAIAGKAWNERFEAQESAWTAKVKQAEEISDKAVSARVMSELASLGMTFDAAPSQIDAQADDPHAKIAKLNQLTGAEKTAYFRANKADLLAAEKELLKNTK